MSIELHKPRALPLIGARWAPGEAVRIDTGAGSFEHLNCRVYSDADSLRVQRVLLAPPKRRGNGRIRGWILAVAIAVVLAAAAFYGSGVA